MKFGNPLNADPQTNVFTELAQQPVSNGQSLGPYDVSTWDAVFVKLNSALGAGGTITCAITWTDVLGNNLGTRTLVAGANAGELHARVRNVGPFVSFVFTCANPGAVTVYLTNRPAQSDGPITPGCGGLVLFEQVAALAATTSTTVDLWGTGGSQFFNGYCGPVTLHCRSDSLGAGAAVFLIDSLTGLQTAMARAAVNSDQGQTVQVMLSPRPMRCQITNSSVSAINVSAAIVCAVG